MRSHVEKGGVLGWTPSNKEGENVISDIYAKVFRHPYVEVAHSYIAD